MFSPSDSARHGRSMCVCTGGESVSLAACMLSVASAALESGSLKAYIMLCPVSAALGATSRRRARRVSGSGRTRRTRCACAAGGRPTTSRRSDAPVAAIPRPREESVSVGVLCWW